MGGGGVRRGRLGGGSCPEKHTPSSGCLHLSGTSVAVSMATGVKIVGMCRDTVRRVVLIAGRELKNEQGAQEVGEDGASFPLSQPEPAGEITAGRRTNRLLLGTGRFVCLLLSPGNDIYSCTGRDAWVKAPLCLGAAEVKHKSYMFHSHCQD